MSDAIETLLRQTIGLDANTIGSRTIGRVVEQRQKECHLPDREAYLALLKTSPQEMTRLIEAIVVPETWFFRDGEPFTYLRQFVKTEWQSDRSKVLRVLSAPCSTGEEAYSIAITLLEAGLKPEQFRIDAIDISQPVLQKAKQAIYSQRSFRGSFPFKRHPYFEAIGESWKVRPCVQQTVKFRQGNLVKGDALKPGHYQVIFCRNLLIYLDTQARIQLLQALDQALTLDGLLFVGAVETGQLPADHYTLIKHPRAFAFRKQRPLVATDPKIDRPLHETVNRSQLPPVTAPILPLNSNQTPPLPSPTPSHLETAQQLANGGQLTRAAALCQSYLRANPTQPQAHLLLGEIYQGMQQLNRAEQCFQKAIYLNPTDQTALLHLALLKELQGDRAGSDHLKRRLQRLISHQRLRDSQALLNSQA